MLLAMAACSKARPGARPTPASAAEPLSHSAPAPVAVTISQEERARITARLSFISERDHDLEVYLIDAGGKAERRLTQRAGGDYNGPASIDGAELLLISVTETPAGSRQSLHVISLTAAAGGQTIRPLGAQRLVVRNPAWSPDGLFVVFEGDSASYRDLYRIRRDGSGLRRLTDNPEGNFEPAVSATGDVLAFISSRDRVAEIYTAHLDGSAPRRLTHTDRDEWSPRWSADGKLLAFASDRDGADRLYVLNGDRTARVTELPIDSAVVEESPRFSPQGSLLAYGVRRPGRSADLFIQDVATGKRCQVAKELQGELAEPAWSPDSRYLAFTVRHGDDTQIYIARSDGSGATPVTTATGPNWNPLWVPPQTAR